MKQQGPEIREPEAPAPDSWARALARLATGRAERFLRDSTPRIAAILGKDKLTLDQVKQITTIDGLRALNVTKGQASLLIRLFTPAESAAA